MDESEDPEAELFQAEVAKSEPVLRALWAGVSEEDRAEAMLDARFEADLRELDWNDAHAIARLAVLLTHGAYFRGDRMLGTPDPRSMRGAAAALAQAEAVFG